MKVNRYTFFPGSVFYLITDKTIVELRANDVKICNNIVAQNRCYRCSEHSTTWITLFNIGICAACDELRKVVCSKFDPLQYSDYQFFTRDKTINIHPAKCYCTTTRCALCDYKKCIIEDIILCRRLQFPDDIQKHIFDILYQVKYNTCKIMGTMTIHISFWYNQSLKLCL